MDVAIVLMTLPALSHSTEQSVRNSSISSKSQFLVGSDVGSAVGAPVGSEVSTWKSAVT